MRAPISWLAEHVDIPQDRSARSVADAMVRIGMEVEKVDSAADGISGPLVVGPAAGLSHSPLP